MPKLPSHDTRSICRIESKRSIDARCWQCPSEGEALAMAKWLRENGVIADAISQHTFERIKETDVE